jgi:hypothetical protein
MPRRRWARIAECWGSCKWATRRAALSLKLRPMASYPGNWRVSILMTTSIQSRIAKIVYSITPLLKINNTSTLPYLGPVFTIGYSLDRKKRLWLFGLWIEGGGAEGEKVEQPWLALEEALKSMYHCITYLSTSPAFSEQKNDHESVSWEPARSHLRRPRVPKAPPEHYS